MFKDNLLKITISRNEIIKVSSVSAFVLVLFFHKTILGLFAIYDDS